jgi:hypothetical protein
MSGPHLSDRSRRKIRAVVRLLSQSGLSITAWQTDVDDTDVLQWLDDWDAMEAKNEGVSVEDYRAWRSEQWHEELQCSAMTAKGVRCRNWALVRLYEPPSWHPKNESRIQIWARLRREGIFCPRHGGRSWSNVHQFWKPPT